MAKQTPCVTVQAYPTTPGPPHGSRKTTANTLIIDVLKAEIEGVRWDDASLMALSAYRCRDHVAGIDADTLAKRARSDLADSAVPLPEPGAATRVLVGCLRLGHVPGPG